MMNKFFKKNSSFRIIMLKLKMQCIFSKKWSNKEKSSGFTLIEMSISILILSILIMGGINFQMATINNSRMNITLDKMKKIENAIDVYFLEHKHLPCPANPTLATSDSNFGRGLEDWGCYEADSDYWSNGLIYGSIPNKTIGLSDDYGVDGWKNTIIYIIHNNYGERMGFVNAEGEAIIVKNLAGDLVTNKAIYLLISSGENRNGAFREGIQLPINTNLSDKNNAHTSGFDNNFIKDIANDLFDDIVYYREKWELLLNLGIEEIECSLTGLRLLDSNWFYEYSWDLCSFNEIINRTCPCDLDGICSQSVEIMAKNACPTSKVSKNPNINTNLNEYVPSRKCLKYGQWSDILYPCIDGCGLSNIESITNCGFPGQLISHIDVNYVKRAALGEYLDVHCVDDYFGNVILHCRSDGQWACEGGKCMQYTVY